MRIAIVYDPGGEGWTAADVKGVLRSVNQIGRIFFERGHEVRRVPVKHDMRWFSVCRKADLVFNLCEGVHGVSKWEDHVVATLDFAGIPFTGAGPWTLAACRRKAVTNAVLVDAGLPVPRWFLAEGPVPEDFPLPAIVKPACEDASAGVDAASVVTDRKALKALLAQMTERFDEVLVQTYVAGREFNVGIVGDRVMPIAEIDYAGMPEGAWPILTYGAKWDAGSPEDLGSRPVCPAVVSARLADRLVRLAQAAWSTMQGKGYGRIDLRVDEAGQPWIIDVNPNPDLDDAAGLSRMARVSGWSYADLCRRLAELALAEHCGKRAAARLLRGGRRLRKEQHA